MGSVFGRRVMWWVIERVGGRLVGVWKTEWNLVSKASMAGMMVGGGEGGMCVMSV